MIISNPKDLAAWALNKLPLWLFLDYDGTLCEFAPTPEQVTPNTLVVSLLEKLSAQPAIRLTILSGRKLSDVRHLVPVPRIYLAGTYGIEILTPEEKLIRRARHEDIRPYLDMVKPKWDQIITGQDGFFLEDKGWALALHARFSEERAAKQILSLAREALERDLPEEHFRILGGHKFLEIAPVMAHKGKTVSYLLEKYGWPKAQLIYVGDDDKDEEAFDMIQAHGGIAIKVGDNPPVTRANLGLDSPSSVRSWLNSLLDRLQE